MYITLVVNTGARFRVVDEEIKSRLIYKPYDCDQRILFVRIHLEYTYMYIYMYIHTQLANKTIHLTVNPQRACVSVRESRGLTMKRIVPSAAHDNRDCRGGQFLLFPANGNARLVRISA